MVAGLYDMAGLEREATIEESSINPPENKKSSNGSPAARASLQVRQDDSSESPYDQAEQEAICSAFYQVSRACIQQPLSRKEVEPGYANKDAV